MKRNWPPTSRNVYNKTTKIHLNPHAIRVRGEKVYGTDTPRFTKCHSRLAWRTEFRVTQKFGFTLAVNGCLLRHVAGKQSHVNVVNPRRRKSRCLSKPAKKKEKERKKISNLILSSIVIWQCDIFALMRWVMTCWLWFCSFLFLFFFNTLMNHESHKG